MSSDLTPASSLRDRAIALRRAGRSRREIKEMLAITSNSTLNTVLAGEPPPAWTRRPNAKDALHAKARALREQGLTYSRIAAELGVSKAAISLWVRDLPRPARLSYTESRRRSAEGVRRYWETERAVREAQREAARAAAATEIGRLNRRELLIAGAIAYWCEGSKNKPHNRQDRVIFTNSDPAMIMFFLRFLGVAGVAPDMLTYRVYIHETADVRAAEHFWLELTGADPAQFRRSTLKTHKPKTVRKNVGGSYRGCLRVEVRRSVKLYRCIEGWARGAMAVDGSS
jgi:predicted transcriptional regulator